MNYNLGTMRDTELVDLLWGFPAEYDAYVSPSIVWFSSAWHAISLHFVAEFGLKAQEVKGGYTAFCSYHSCCQ